MMANSGQTLNDRLNAARYALAGQGLARVVCKATTEEMIAPKKKHIDYLLQCTNEPNVSIPQLANHIIERTSHSSWVVVFKALVTMHHLMCFGNERLTQYLASSNCNFQLNNFIDKNQPRGYEMSAFIRRYARYLNAKAMSYRTVAFDFTKVKRGSEGQLRSMNFDKLLKTVPVLQGQIDALLEFDANPSDLTNPVINAAFFLLFKDLIRLFACYNDGIISCLERYFELSNKKLVRETYEAYKKFLVRMNKVSDFMKVAEAVGIDKGEILDLTKAPSSLIEAMEQHLYAVEGKKPGTASTNGESGSAETTVKKAIEEEEKFLNKLKTDPSESEKHAKSAGGSTVAASSSSSKAPVNNPFMIDVAETETKAAAGAAASNSKDILDMWGAEEKEAPAANNPFADILSSIKPAASTAAAAAGKPDGAFATSDNFAAAFGETSNSNIVSNLFDLDIEVPPQYSRPFTYTPRQGFDAFGDVLQPQNVLSVSSTPIVPTPVNNSNNQAGSLFSMDNTSNGGGGGNKNGALNNGKKTGGGMPNSTSSPSLIKGDLDATLANLASNLDINASKSSAAYKKGQVFNVSPKSQMKTGGGSINSPSPSFPATPSPIQWSVPMGAVAAPMLNTAAGMPQSMWNMPVPAPTPWAATMAGGGVGGMPASQSMFLRPTAAMGVQPAANPFMARQPTGSHMPGAVPVFPLAQQTASAAAAAATTANNNSNIDPFGAL